ncbi:hypothetical protein H5410_001643 [Solanum commersonii]|uniref:Isopentenyltransferase n=1 Tax=Solanum commersonii TaxID=4109 RepID=A0A9J6AZK6_SOLCO|nr:hypothetical protein H5410_001643 [Solanum commersonii]
MNTYIKNNKKFNKKNVVFIMGATGKGKSRLSVHLATHFRGQIINSDKMEVYKGLDIVTKKTTQAEKQGVRHYLLEQSVLNRRVDTRVDEMNMTKGVRWSIVVLEMASYLREEKNIDGDDESKKMILQASISSIKRITCILICNQLDKIQRLINEKMWSVQHIIATDIFKEDRKEVVDEAWRNTVLQPCLGIGATRTGKSRLSVDLATHFRGELINLDKMQVYKGLDIVTNKIAHAEKQNERHYLIGLVDEVWQIFIPDAEYTKGIRWSIGVPEMASYLREEKYIDRDDNQRR